MLDGMWLKAFKFRLCESIALMSLFHERREEKNQTA